MKEYPFHPTANIFPLLSQPELKDLASDIKANGLRQPIILFEKQILDGRNRFNACKLSDVEPTFKEYEGKEPLKFVISLNLKRRHLNESQRALIAARLADMEFGDNQYKRVGKSADPISQPQASKLLNISERSLRDAKQIMAKAPHKVKEIEDGKLTIHETLKEIKADEKTKARALVAKAGAQVPDHEKWHIYQGNIENWKPIRKYDFIITDPPYPKEYLHLYETLAIRAKEWLYNDGLLIAMCGQSYLNEIFALLTKHLTYYWTAAYLTPGQPTPLRQINVNSSWKPLLIFKKNEYKGKIFSDVFKSDGADKDYHKWGQSVSGMSDIISGICLPGQYVLDPFCGAGTTGIAAISHGCLFDGLELDIETVNLAKGRLHDAATH